MALVGNTVRYTATFRRFDGVAADPDNLTFSVVDNTNRQLFAIPLTIANKLSTGVYYYDYTIPGGMGDITIYFNGILEGEPIRGVTTDTRTFK